MRKTLLATGLATVAAAVAGSVSSQNGVQGWYTTIRKPDYVPRNAVFPLAWTALYVDIAATSAAVIDRFRAEGQPAKARGYIAALATNLVLNAGWSWVFFGKRKLAPAVAGAALLAVSSADLTRRAADADVKFGAALAPYPLWCTFATVMSADIWRLNR
jgi:tryptophan-rich sensory protein